MLHDRLRAKRGLVGSSGTDVEPMELDRSVWDIYVFISHYITFSRTTSFEDIGGLDHHIRALKEMIVFPLLYPEIFQRFNVLVSTERFAPLQHFFFVP